MLSWEYLFDNFFIKCISHVVSTGKVLVNDEVRGLENEVVVALFRHFLVGTDDYTKPESVQTLH
jgi:hypothetical protein